LAKPDAWAYLRPILAENGGWAVFIWTPRGRNHATRAFEARERDPANWYTLRSPATQTGVFTPAQLAANGQELISELAAPRKGEAKLPSGVPGRLRRRRSRLLLRRPDRSGAGRGPHRPLPLRPGLPVMTAWDIGVDDYTAVWFLQQQGQQVRAIDYAETSGDGAEQIVRAYLPELIPDPQDPAAAVAARQARADALAALGRAVPYKYGIHHLPHDVMVREWGAGAKTRYQTLIGLGVRPSRSVWRRTRWSGSTRPGVCCPPSPSTPSGAWPASTGCATTASAGTRPPAPTPASLHDENSHGADAFGEFAVNCSIVPAKPAAPPTVPPDRARWGPQKVANGWKTR
jgi:phage terminase large subunit